MTSLMPRKRTSRYLRQGSAVRHPPSRALLLGLAGNGLVCAIALRRFGTGNVGLRVATRATGQTVLLPYVAAFAGTAAHRLKPAHWTRWMAERRMSFLWGCAGGHVVHIPLIASLMARHGHPQKGTRWLKTPMYPVSVYGGALGYTMLIYLLASEAAGWRATPSARRLAAAGEWYILLGPHLVPTLHGYFTKNRSRKLYGPTAGLFVFAAMTRLGAACAPPAPQGLGVERTHAPWRAARSRRIWARWK